MKESAIRKPKNNDTFNDQLLNILCGSGSLTIVKMKSGTLVYRSQPSTTLFYVKVMLLEMKVMLYVFVLCYKYVTKLCTGCDGESGARHYKSQEFAAAVASLL